MRTLKHTSQSHYHCRGFSMVELMVALVITLILLAGIGQIFLSSKKSFIIQNNLARIQENGRYAMDVVDPTCVAPVTGVVTPTSIPSPAHKASTPPRRSHAPLRTRLTGRAC